jgi:hypothetical protein
MRGSRALRVPLELARANELLPHLEPLVIEPLARRLEARVAAGDTLASRDLGWGAVPLAVWCAALIAAGAAALLTVRFAEAAIGAIHRGIVGLRQSCRGFRGGLHVEANGLRAPGATAARPWSQLAIKSDSAGLIVHDGTSRPLRLSSSATNFVIVRALLLRRINSSQA